ncbi:hypothetical protein B0T25DRAFT_583682 [Lasiosphaeria hispida]|uniref:Secreted protein n=1 Tax=Lasiosphaeria hispida TaxID=260671 RepID=A0AAJ0MAV7_9PEZI|nr:hypothetical protein B0T25DRAFT_583682 [Lasiosphaeria hispida]
MMFAFPSATSLLGTAAGLVMLAAPAQARTWAGGVDMEQACDWQYAPNWSAVLIVQSSSGWICTDGTAIRSIDVGYFCRRRYGSNAYADPQGGGPYDWGCYFP